jgi:hypothetical protein
MFLALAGLLIFQELVKVRLTLFGPGEVRWVRSVVLPLALCAAVAWLWSGNTWLKWLVGLGCAVSGGLVAFSCGTAIVLLARMTPPDDPGLFRVIALPLAIVGGVGALNLAAGLLMLYSPALNAFFKHQREGPDLLETVDALNAASGGGEPTTVDKVLGKLAVPSGTLILGDPQYLPQFEVPGIVDEEVEISAQLWQYPSGAAMVTAVLLKFGDGVYNGPPESIGRIGIDSAKLVVADKAELEEHWTQMGEDRIGVISTARDDRLLRMLTKRFGLKTVRKNPIRAEVVGEVSQQLATDIETFLKTMPEYAKFPFMHFHVQTNNSFDRVNYLRESWSFIPVGNSDLPLMFICETGRGDGCYNVQCGYAGGVPRLVSIQFIDDAGDGTS